MSGFTRDLYTGLDGDDVADLQARLQFLGYFDGAIDGRFSASTEHAVQEYQHAMGNSATGALDVHAAGDLQLSTDGHHFDPQIGHSGGYYANVALRRRPAQHQPEDLDTTMARLDGRTVDFADGDDAVLASHGDYYDVLHQTLLHVSTRALTLANHNDAAFARACQAFRSKYALPKIHELESRVTGEDLAKQFVRSAMDLSGIRLCSQLAGGVAKTVIEQISVGLSRKASNLAKSAFSNEGSAKALTMTVEQLITDLETNGAVLEELSHQALTTALAPVFDVVQRRQPLPAEDDAWVARFYGATDVQIDEGIEEVFGIPGAARTVDMELDVYEKLVEDFTALYLHRSEAGLFPARPDAHEQYENDPDRRARAQAHEARARREAELT